MLLAWPDGPTERACTAADVGVAVWGKAGQCMVGQVMILIGEAVNLARLCSMPTVTCGIRRLGRRSLLVIGYRAVEILGSPYDANQRPMPIPPDEQEMISVHDAECLRVYRVQCEGRAATKGRAA